MAKRPTKSKQPRPEPQTRIRARCIRALEREGRLDAKALVDAARDKKHPMHGDFEWRDDVAGEAYRLIQARGYIASVRVVITQSTKKIVAPGYVHDPAAGRGPGYVTMARLQTEREHAEEAMMNEINRVQAALERSREIAAALDLSEEHEAAMNAVLVLASRIRRGRVETEEMASAAV